MQSRGASPFRNPQSPAGLIMKSNNLWEWLEPKLAIVKFLMEVCALAAVVVYASITYGQWQAVQKSNTINRMNAEAAQSAAATAAATLETSAQSFRQEQRAYLWPSSFGISEDISSCPNTTGTNRLCANVHISNSGRTPALGVHLYCYTTLGPDVGTISNAVKSMEIPSYTVPSGDVFGSSGDKWKSCAIDGVDDKAVKDIMDGKIPVYVFGIVQYFDIFGEYHETGFCSYRLPNRGPFLSCDYGNWFDKKPADPDAQVPAQAQPK